MHWLLWLSVAGVILTFSLRLLGLDWISIPPDLVVAAIIDAALVGFAAA